jgi:hypothetical protein
MLLLKQTVLDVAVFIFCLGSEKGCTVVEAIRFGRLLSQTKHLLSANTSNKPRTGREREREREREV